jgi:hypothetical protein
MTPVERLHRRLAPLFADVDPDVSNFVLDALRNPFGYVVADEATNFALRTDVLRRRAVAVLRGEPRGVVMETLRQISAELKEKVNQ